MRFYEITLIAVFLTACTPDPARVESVASMEASRLAAPSRALSSFSRFELAPMTFSQPIQAEEGKMREAREFEIAYEKRINGLLHQWNTNVRADASDTLVVKTDLVGLRIISGGARFWAGAFAGDSFLDLSLKLVNKHTGEQISDVRVRKDADAMGGAWSVGQTDQNLDQYVIEIIRTYLINSYDISGPDIQRATGTPGATVPLEQTTVVKPTQPGGQSAKIEAAAGTSTAATLAALKTLHDQGMLSDEEYARKWHELLDTQSNQSPANPEGDDVATALAALKVMHEQGELTDAEYMQRQRELIDAHTKKTRTNLGFAPTAASASTDGDSSPGGRFRVALLPIASLSGRAYSQQEVVYSDYVHKYIKANPELQLVFSEYGAGFEHGSAGSFDAIWRGSFTDKKPDEASVVSGAKRVGANAAVLISYKKRTAGWYGEEFNFDIFIYSTESGKMFHGKGTELDYERVIDRTFKDLLANRPT